MCEYSVDTVYSAQCVQCTARTVNTVCAVHTMQYTAYLQGHKRCHGHASR
jgi:hypothetical protein